MSSSSLTTSSSSSSTSTNRTTVWPTGTSQGRSLLASLCKNDQQKRVAALLSIDILVSSQTATPEQVATGRPSYVNATLIQSRGVVNDVACEACRTKRNPFEECRSLPGEWEGACGNCKWKDHGSRCMGAVVGPRVAGEIEETPREVVEIEDNE